MKFGVLLAAVAMLAPQQVRANGRPATSEPITFNASVRVEVDAAGMPVKVEAPAEFPDAMRQFIQKRVSSWQYQPAMQDGEPVPAVTYVRVGACAVPAEGGYRLGLDFKGNGPALVNDRGWFLPPPAYPRSPMMAGVEGEFLVNYSIRADGSTHVDEIKAQTVSNRAYARDFQKTLTAWAEGFHYRPEQVNGIPVATQMSIPVSFSLSNNPRQDYAKEEKARALASSECVAAAQSAGLTPIAQNSPIKVTPPPAG